MPSGPDSKIVREVSTFNGGSGDTSPGTSVISGTGAAQYGGQVGARVWLDSQSIRYTTNALYGGVYQYVYMTYTTKQPLRGNAVFWDLSVAEALYQVNGDAKPATAVPTLIAGVSIITTWTKATYGWIQIAGRASCLFDSGVTAAVAGNLVSPKVSSSVASCFDVGAVAAPAVLAIGVAETQPSTSTISVVQLNSVLLERI